jgi:protein-arginine deiminase
MGGWRLSRWWVLGAVVSAMACGGGGPLVPNIEGTPNGSTTETVPVTIPAVEVAIVDLRADVNRNGVVDLSDASEDADEDTWTSTHGAIFLANIDDDLERCSLTNASGQVLNDVELPKCNDASDEIINGASDLLDLARLKTVPWPKAPEGAVGRITVSPAGRARFFKGKGDSFSVFSPETDRFTAAELREGVELAVEGLDIVREDKVWDGFLNVTLAVGAPAVSPAKPVDEKDVLRLRIAPVLTYHHGSRIETSYVSLSPGYRPSESFATAMQSALNASELPRPLVKIDVDDPWAQDYFETGYMSMPAAGAPHVIRVNFRSSNIESNSTTDFLRAAGKVVFAMRGQDIAGVEEYDWPMTDRQAMTYRFQNGGDSLNSFGNTETIPPYSYGGESFPVGRLLRGKGVDRFPDEKFTRMLESQRVQRPLYINTGWLAVGHVDETVSFLPVNSPRGWVLLINDARMALKMLRDEKARGNGSVRMFTGLSWSPTVSAEASIDQVLADANVIGASEEAAVAVDSQRELLQQATGLTDDEIIPIPFLHMSESGGSIAYQPGMVNGQWVGNGHFLAPDPHGPVIGGKDIFKAAMEASLSKLGTQVHWVEDWTLLHVNMGEVHCGSNATRAVPAAAWWGGQ